MKRGKWLLLGGVLVLIVGGGVWWQRGRKAPQTSDLPPVLAYTQHGKELAKAGRVTEAVVAFNRAIALEPANPEPYIGLAVLYESANRPDLAIETLEMLRATNPQAKGLKTRLAEAHLGADDLKGAREWGEQAVKAEGDDARSHSVYGLTLLRFRYWDSAAEHLQKAMQLAPEDGEIGLVLMDVYIQKADYPQATQFGETLLTKLPQSARLHYKLGWGYGRQPARGDTTEKAIRYLQKAIEIAPQWFEPYAELGRIYNSLGRTAEAATAFEKSWERNKSVPGVAYNLAILWRKLGDPRAGEMERLYQKQMKEKEKITAMRRDYNGENGNVTNTLALAAVEGRTGQYGTALYRLHKLLITDPANIQALELYVRLDQEIRARYPNYLRPGPGITAPGG